MGETCELLSKGSFTYMVQKLDDKYIVVDSGGRVVFVEKDLDHAENAIQYALDNLPDYGGKVLLAEGSFVISADVDIPDSVEFIGSGNSTVFNFSSQKVFNIGNDIIIRAFRITGNGQILIKGSHVLLENITMEVGNLHQGAFRVQVEDTTLEDITFVNCKVVDSGTHGFHFEGSGSPRNLQKVTMINCKAINCGRYEPRLSDWVTGFNFSVMDEYRDISLIGCIAEGSWESGFHFEDVSTKTNVEFIGCISKDNGQKSNPSYGAGYLLSTGIKVYDSISVGNKKQGFRLYNNKNGILKISNCYDYGSGTLDDFRACSLYIQGTVGQTIIEDFTSLNSGKYGIAAYDTSNIFARNIKVINATGDSSSHAENRLGYSGHPIENCDIDIFIKGGSESYAIYIYAKDLILSGHIETSKYGVYVNGTAGAPSENIKLRNLYIQAEIEGIGVAGTVSNVRIKNVWIEDLQSTPTLAYGIAGTSGVIAHKDTITIINAATDFHNVLFLSNSGIATIPNGNSSVVVNHGLAKAPEHGVRLTGTHSEVANCWVTNVTDTQFTINAPANVTADRDVYWETEM